jgi:hypothetical protein
MNDKALRGADLARLFPISPPSSGVQTIGDGLATFDSCSAPIVLEVPPPYETSTFRMPVVFDNNGCARPDRAPGFNERIDAAVAQG